MYELTENESRVINKLKAFFIMLVVLIHTRAYTGKGYVNYVGGAIDLNVPQWLFNIEYIISAVIAHCAVPGFFIISSILLYRKEFKWFENIKKKVRTICIPCFVIITFWILLYAILQKVPFLAPFFSNESKIIAEWGWFQYLDAYFGLTGSPLVYPLWFAQNLMFLNIIAKPLKMLIDRFPRLIAVVLLILTILPIDSLFFCLEKSSLVFFCLGYYIVKYDIKISLVKKLNVYLLTILYIVAIYFVFVMKDASFIYLIDLINICLGLLWFTRISFIVPYNKVIRMIAQYSFFVFIMHEMWLRIMLKAVAKFLGTSVFVQLVQYFVIPIIIISGCIIFALILKKVLPKFYLILNGSRI